MPSRNTDAETRKYTPGALAEGCVFCVRRWAAAPRAPAAWLACRRAAAALLAVVRALCTPYQRPRPVTMIASAIA